MSRLKNTSRDYDGLCFPKVVHPKTVTTEDFLSEIPKSYIYRKPEKMLCKKLHVTEKDIKRYEDTKVEEGELFGLTSLK